MQFDQHYLLARIDNLSQSSEAIKNMIKEIKKNDSVRKGINLVHFLKEPVMLLPKEKAIRDKYEKTRWEEFAERKGIEKRKKPFFIVDEETGTKSHRYGAKSQKNLELRSGIYENDQSYSKIRREKDKRVKKNAEAMIKNKEKIKNSTSKK